MAKFRSLKNSLIGGEVSGSVLGRTDLPQYAHACKTLKNMVPMLSGGASKRPGTIYQDSFYQIDSEAAQIGTPYLVPFRAANELEYALLFVPAPIGGGTGKIYAYASDGANKTYGNGDKSDLTFCPSTRYSVTNDAHSMRDDELRNLRYAQSGDVIFFTNGVTKPFIIQLTAGPTFTCGDFDSTAVSQAEKRDAWPYAKQNTTATTISCSATSGNGITVTVSSVVFYAGDVGSVIKINVGGAIGAVKITGTPTGAGPQTFTADVICNLGSTAATANWWRSAWSGTQGYPMTVEFFKQRIAWGGNSTYPDSIWFSKKENYYTLSKDTVTNPDVDPTGNDPFTLTLANGSPSSIKWMKASKQFLVGTLTSEWLIGPEVDGSPFGGDNKAAARQSEYGSNGIIAFTGNEIFFVSADGTTLRSFAFSYYDQSYVADEIQVFYNEYPREVSFDFEDSGVFKLRRFSQIAWDDSRDTLWCIDTAGNWVGLTRNKKLQINAWHSHELGGYDASDVPAKAERPQSQLPFQYSCNGSVASIASVGDRWTGQQSLWMVVRRHINGWWMYSIETMRGRAPSSSTAYSDIIPYQSIFTDCSTVLKVDPTDSPIASTYICNGLEGETVVGTANRGENGMFALKSGTVSSGLVSNTDMKWGSLPSFPGTNDGKYWWLSFGLPFESVIEPVRVEAGSIVGTSQGAMKRIHKAFVRFFRTLAAKVGPDSSRLEAIEFRTSLTPLNKSAELFTGDKEVSLDSDYDRDGYIRISSDTPLPLSVVAIVAEGQTYD